MIYADAPPLQFVKSWVKVTPSAYLMKMVKAVTTDPPLLETVQEI